MSHPRKPFVGGNWKMNTDLAAATALASGIAAGVSADTALSEIDIVLFPPFPYLLVCSGVLGSTRSVVRLGAQDCYHAARGAFTGEVAPPMVKDCGGQWVLCGHSERRHILHEGDVQVNAKARAALAAGLGVVLCVGEKLEQRLTGQTDTVTERQVRLGLRDVSAQQLGSLVIGYEPVWAIGTGKTATPADAQDAHAKIRSVVGDMFGHPAAEGLRIIYGGSVNPTNAAGLFTQVDVDGGLIGGASLNADEFLHICRAAVK